MTGTRTAATRVPTVPAGPPKPAGVVVVPAPTGVITTLPGVHNSLALTIDDGTDADVVAAYTTLAADTGIRLTFFPNGCYPSWADNARALRPLVESGQATMGNHTWSHPDLTGLTDADVAEEITRNDRFVQNTFGVTSAPFFRPPFGAHTDRTDAIAADLGHRTIVMWDGTLGDHRVLTGPELLAAAREWFRARSIVIGHANHPAVIGIYADLVDLLAERKLQTVTLADVWANPT